MFRNNSNCQPQKISAYNVIMIIFAYNVLWFCWLQTGCERDEIVLDNRTVVLREIGGNMRTVWSSYFDAANLIIFLWDLSSPFLHSHSLMEFVNLMKSEKLHSKPILVGLNKTDVAGPLPRKKLFEMCSVESIIQESKSTRVVPTYLFDISCATGEGFNELVECLKMHIITWVH